MKRTVIATALAASLLVTGLANAENALFPSNNASAEVAFYTADPASKGVLLTTTMVNNSPVATSIGEIDTATYVTITYNGESYTFPLAESGANKNEVMLETTDTSVTAQYISDTGTVSLGEVISGLTDDPQLLETLSSNTAVS